MYVSMYVCKYVCPIEDRVLGVSCKETCVEDTQHSRIFLSIVYSRESGVLVEGIRVRYSKLRNKRGIVNAVIL